MWGRRDGPVGILTWLWPCGQRGWPGTPGGPARRRGAGGCFSCLVFCGAPLFGCASGGSLAAAPPPPFRLFFSFSFFLMHRGDLLIESSFQ